jgi:hypothetical protein
MAQSGWSGLGAVALFVFLAGAAWAGIVAADFVAGDAGSAAVGAGVPAGVAGLLQFALLLALELFFQLVDGGGRRTGGDGHVGMLGGLAGAEVQSCLAR